jgi:hypothetical protein
VLDFGLAIHIKKYLKAKEELWKLKYFTMQKSTERNQNPPRYCNFVTNLQALTRAKISSFKNPHIKIDLLLRGQNP